MTQSSEPPPPSPATNDAPGLQKLSPDGEWSWKDTLDGFSPGEFSAAASFQDWAEGSDASSSYSDEGASCLEIMPYTPKVWNAFSCEVGGRTKGGKKVLLEHHVRGRGGGVPHFLYRVFMEQWGHLTGAGGGERLEAGFLAQRN